MKLNIECGFPVEDRVKFEETLRSHYPDPIEFEEVGPLVKAKIRISKSDLTHLLLVMPVMEFKKL